ncbi:hypothetical protein PHYBOEH_002119 [Phytophthora boehmeriae]|uniref:Acyltransferase 3 domain-containing protein n=1 Tax=Phytophthora boehmeriae TaxID=109152 RepID=A0A8T1WV12_9STRA|nr:hypothetical protein PHYBOEH_002119 [Phytophthora boehmeriae]
MQGAETHNALRIQVVDGDRTQDDLALVNHKMEVQDPTQRQPAPQISPVAKILFLDGVRGAAVTLVVMQHARYMHDIFMGAVGVDAFFVLSSFLLTMIFMKKSMKLLAEQASYRKWGYTLAD